MCEETIYKDSRDKKSYKIVRIGQQIWFAENLRYNCPNAIRYDGIEDNNAYCENTQHWTSSQFGYLYPWNALTNDIAPEGWRIPTQADFEELIKYVEENCDCKAGKALKATGYWKNDEGDTGLDLFGFSALPAGYGQRKSFDRDRDNGEFGFSTDFWTIEDCNTESAYSFNIHMDQDDFRKNTTNKRIACSLRLIKCNNITIEDNNCNNITIGDKVIIKLGIFAKKTGTVKEIIGKKLKVDVLMASGNVIAMDFDESSVEKVF